MLTGQVNRASGIPEDDFIERKIRVGIVAAVKQVVVPIFAAECRGAVVVDAQLSRLERLARETPDGELGDDDIVQASTLRPLRPELYPFGEADVPVERMMEPLLGAGELFEVGMSEFGRI